MKLNGWTRLGIVLSIAWVILVIGLATIEYFTDSKNDSLLVSRHDARPKPWEIDWLNEDTKLSEGDVFDPDEYLLSKGMTQDEIDSLSIEPNLRIINLGLLLFLPVLMMWTVGFSYSWVWEGFRKQRRCISSYQKTISSRVWTKSKKMTEEEYNVGYYLDMVKVMEKTEKLVEQYHSTDSEEIKWSIMELIAIYYSKPFLGSNRSYTRPDGSRHPSHRIDAADVGFDKNERKVHDVAFDWRNGYIAHSDQEKRDQEVKLKRKEDGRVIGFESSSSYSGIPLLDFQLKTLTSNLSKIKNHLWSKIWS